MGSCLWCPSAFAQPIPETACIRLQHVWSGDDILRMKGIIGWNKPWKDCANMHAILIHITYESCEPYLEMDWHACHASSYVLSDLAQELRLLALQHWATFLANEGLCNGKCGRAFWGRFGPWFAMFVFTFWSESFDAMQLEVRTQLGRDTTLLVSSRRAKRTLPNIEKLAAVSRYNHAALFLSLWPVQDKGVPIADALKNPLTPACTSSHRSMHLHRSTHLWLARLSLVHCRGKHILHIYSESLQA